MNKKIECPKWLRFLLYSIVLILIVVNASLYYRNEKEAKHNQLVYERKNFIDKIEIPDEIEKLPDIQFRNYYTEVGALLPLHQTMVLDETGELQRLVENFCQENDIAKRNELVENIVCKWTGYDDKYKIAMRYLNLEFDPDEELNLYKPEKTEYERAYNRLLENVYSELLIQSHYKDSVSQYVAPYYLEEHSAMKNIDKYIAENPENKIPFLSDITRIMTDKSYEFNTLEDSPMRRLLLEKYSSCFEEVDKYSFMSKKSDFQDNSNRSAYNIFYSSSADEVIYGNEYFNTFYLSSGTDTFYGKGGGDLYFFKRGDGINTIYEEHPNLSSPYFVENSNGNAIVFDKTIQPEDIILEYNKDNELIIKIQDTEDQIIVKNFLKKGNSENDFLEDNTYAVENLYFDNGKIFFINYWDGKIELQELNTRTNLMSYDKKKIDDILSKYNGELTYSDEKIDLEYEKPPKYIDYDAFFIKDKKLEDKSGRYADITADKKLSWKISEKNGERHYERSPVAKEMFDALTLDGEKFTLPSKKLSDFGDEYAVFDRVDLNLFKDFKYPASLTDMATGNKLYIGKDRDLVYLLDKENVVLLAFETGLLQKNGLIYRVESLYPKLEIKVGNIGIGSTLNEVYDEFGQPSTITNDIGGKTISYSYDDEKSGRTYSIQFKYDRFSDVYIKELFNDDEIRNNVVTDIWIQIIKHTW